MLSFIMAADIPEQKLVSGSDFPMLGLRGGALLGHLHGADDLAQSLRHACKPSTETGHPSGGSGVPPVNEKPWSFIAGTAMPLLAGLEASLAVPGGTGVSPVNDKPISFMAGPLMGLGAALAGAAPASGPGGTGVPPVNDLPSTFMAGTVMPLLTGLGLSVAGAALPPETAPAALPHVTPAALPAEPGGVVQVQVTLGVDEQANLTAAVSGAATGTATRVVQEMAWQRGALVKGEE